MTVKSQALRGRGDITLYIPALARAQRNAPLVLLLHGAHGSHWNWAVNGRAHRTAQRLMEQGTIPPLALAMPSDGLWGDGSGYLPHARQDFEKWIVEDALQAVRGAAGCLSGDSPLFICGLSMGGFGALRLGAKYTGLFRGISAHSSITHFEQMLKYVAEDAASFGTPPEDLSVLATMVRHKDHLPPVRFDCGVEDRLAQFNRELHRDLEASGIAHQYEEFPGGHEWSYWAAHLEDSLRFFGRILAGKLSI